MSRDALVVGINLYESEQLNSLKAPSEDAEAIAQLLSRYGGFRVHRLPEVKDQATHATRVGRKTRVTLTELEEALVQLFKPEGEHIPETALFYFSGHGLRKERGIQEGFLASSDVNPALNNWGLRLKWLRELLQESPIRQQIVWLDCCYSGELLNFKDNLEEADPGNLETRDRCFIAASREYEVAYEETTGNHGILTGALLQALDPDRRPDGLVSNFTLTEAVNQALKSTTQRPLFANFGNKIVLTGRQTAVVTGEVLLDTVCPYRGLAYFDCKPEDVRFFYGRTSLTDALLEKVRDSNFVAVVGASGSGKSSVVRAGLLYQLKLGQRLSGSHEWPIYIFRPGEKPLQNLAKVFVAPGLPEIVRADYFHKAQDLINAGAIGLSQLISACEASRVVLVIDQFEECFTLCRDSTERQQFFDCLLGALDRLGDQLCVILTLRADFFGQCLHYAGLAKQMEDNLMTVKPMTQAELRQAITEPAKQVGLEIEPELVTQMVLDVESSPGSLPLLQYTLTALWQQRVVNWLTFAAYNALGGVRGTLQRRAEEVYATLSGEEQETARRIFLELTQLGEGTEDTCRHVLKRELITAKHPEALVDRVIQRLSAERLVVASELVERSGNGPGRVEVIDVAHEALIRYWPRLRQWIEANRMALKQKRAIEAAAEEWLAQGQPAEFAYLLQGPKLAEAENFLQTQADQMPLCSLAETYIQASQAARDRLQRQAQIRKRWKIGTAIAFPTLVALAAGLIAIQQRQAQQTLQAIFLSADEPQLLSALSSLHQQAQTRKIQADRSGNPVDVRWAMAYYRALRAETLKLLRKVEDVPQQFPTLVQAKPAIAAISSDAENSLAQLIATHRFPHLQQQLEQKKFGLRPQTHQYADLDTQYTGALQTTYQILMQDAGADLNEDGRLNPIDEPEQLPCQTLLSLDQRWRSATQKATGKACGWYGPDFDGFSNPGCAAVPTFAGRTLAFWIFDTDYEAAIARIKTCEKQRN